MSQIGDEGTEQFKVRTLVNGKLIGEQKIHDPFTHTTVTLKGFGHAWRALFQGIRVNVSIDGTHGATRAVMMLDPEKMQGDTEEFLREQAERRRENLKAGLVGYYAENSVAVQ